MVSVATFYIFDILKNQYFYVYHLEICNLIYLQYDIKFLIIYFFRYFFSYNDFILCIWSILLPLYILLLSFNDVLNIYLKLSPLNVEPYAILYYIIITSKFTKYIFTNKKNAVRQMLMNFFTHTDMYINVNIALLGREVSVRYFLIRPFQKVKLPFNLNIFLSFIQLYIYAPV